MKSAKKVVHVFFGVLLLILCFLQPIQSATAAHGNKGAKATSTNDANKKASQSPPHVTVVSNEDCEKRVPSSFTAAQKKQLCSFTVSAGVTASKSSSSTSTGGIGPAICASVGKQLLHGGKFETILALCQGASSAAPVQCYDKVESSSGGSSGAARGKIGLELCAQADSALPGECYAEVSSYSGTANKVKPEVLLPFCRSLEDRAPLLCLQAVKDTGLLPVNAQTLELCSEVVGSGSKSSVDGNTAAADCIRTMHSEVRNAHINIFSLICVLLPVIIVPTQ